MICPQEKEDTHAEISDTLYLRRYKNLIAYVALLLFLCIKPTGLFNERAIQDV